jgi:hypothetical protein
VERVKADAERTTSRLATISPKDDWHQRVAKLLNHFLKKPDSLEAELIRDLPLIPLTDGTWDSAGSIYYPNVASISIPHDLSLSLVDPYSFQHNPARKTLFDNLGVTTAPREKVRKLILRKEKGQVSLLESIDHLRYLWWTHVDGDPALDGTVNVFSLSAKRLLPRRHDIYFHSVRDLLISNDSDKDDDDADTDKGIDDKGGEVESGDEESDDEGYDEEEDPEERDNDEGDAHDKMYDHDIHDEMDRHINFLHPAYLGWHVPSSGKSRPSWREWLGDCVGV